MGMFQLLKIVFLFIILSTFVDWSQSCADSGGDCQKTIDCCAGSVCAKGKCSGWLRVFPCEKSGAECSEHFFCCEGSQCKDGKCSAGGSDHKTVVNKQKVKKFSSLYDDYYEDYYEPHYKYDRY